MTAAARRPGGAMNAAGWLARCLYALPIPELAEPVAASLLMQRKADAMNGVRRILSSNEPCHVGVAKKEARTETGRRAASMERDEAAPRSAPVEARANPAPAGEWLTAAEAADYLRLRSVNALYQRAARGQIQPYRLGRQMRFRRRDLDALMRPA